MVLIVFNAIALGLETSPSVTAVMGQTLYYFDTAVIIIFCIEVTLRIYAHRRSFFRDPWSLFDLIVVVITLVPSSDSFSVLRSLRVLRVLRLVSAVPRLRRVVAALLHAVPGVASVAALLLIVFYVFAVISTKLFGQEFPVWFGTVGGSMYSLFQIMTLESWSMGIVRPVMEVFPWAWIVFVTFIMLSSFTVLNLFIAIMIDSMQAMHREEHEQTVGEVRAAVHEEHELRESEFQELRRELAEIKALLRKSSDQSSIS